MAYDVKYIGDKEVIKSYLDNREDRIGGSFDELFTKLNQMFTFLYDQNNRGYLRLTDNIVIFFGKHSGEASGGWKITLPIEVSDVLYMSASFNYNNFRDVAATNGSLQSDRKTVIITPYRTSTGATFSGIQAGSYLIIGII